MVINQSGQVLKDKNSKGKDRKWRDRKIDNVKLSKAFDDLSYKENLVEKVRDCGAVLRFRQQENGLLKLYQAFFCKNKLCPICNWRRAMKHSWQSSQIVDEAIKRKPKGRFLFLTLTVENVEGKQLNKASSDLTKSFDRLFRRKVVSKNLIGYLRSTEVTVEEKRQGYYHPHLHVLMMVESSYFNTSDNYISQADWSDMWRQSAKLDYQPVVNIKAVKPKDKTQDEGEALRKAILETAKYPTKPIKFDEQDIQIVDDLYQGLFRKRQLGYGGLFKEIRKELFLDDVENGDLVHTSDDEKVTEGLEIVAIWNNDRKNYFIK